jgi:hypothetical protein
MLNKGYSDHKIRECDLEDELEQVFGGELHEGGEHRLGNVDSLDLEGIFRAKAVQDFCDAFEFEHIGEFGVDIDMLHVLELVFHLLVL